MTGISPWRVAVAVMIAGIVAFIFYVILRAAIPASWEFSVEMRTQVAELTLRPQSETQWQIDGATFCVARDPGVPADILAVAEPNPCSRRMRPGFRIAAPEQVVTLRGGASALIQTMPDGGYAMILRAAAGESLGTLSVVGVVDGLALGERLDLYWTAATAEARNYPFSGSTTLGRAVAWSDARLLESGSVAVYTGDVSADKRTLVDEATLMLGDQVSLGAPAGADTWPKGFVRVSAGESALDAVAFGRADSLRIERFGGSGYDFRPALLSRLASDPRIAFWGSVLAAYMTLILGLQPFMSRPGGGARPAGLRQRMRRWFRPDSEA